MEFTRPGKKKVRVPRQVLKQLKSITEARKGSQYTYNKHKNVKSLMRSNTVVDTIRIGTDWVYHKDLHTLVNQISKYTHHNTGIFYTGGQFDEWSYLAHDDETQQNIYKITQLAQKYKINHVHYTAKKDLDEARNRGTGFQYDNKHHISKKSNTIVWGIKVSDKDLIAAKLSEKMYKLFGYNIAKESWLSIKMLGGSDGNSMGLIEATEWTPIQEDDETQHKVYEMIKAFGRYKVRYVIYTAKRTGFLSETER